MSKSLMESDIQYKLGIIFDPDKNRVVVNENVHLEFLQLFYTFSESELQKKEFGTVNLDVWLEFLPWHSTN
jgi:hypothetical protein